MIIYVCVYIHLLIPEGSVESRNLKRCPGFKATYVPFVITWDMTHSHVWHDPFTCVTWPIHMCDMTHSHVWHDLLVHYVFLCVALVSLLQCVAVCCSVLQCVVVWCTVLQCVAVCNTCFHVWLIRSWRNHVCDTTHSHVTHLNVWHDSFIRQYICLRIDLA